MSGNSEPLSSVENNESQSLVRRLRWFMVGSSLISVVISLFLTDLSFTTGLVIGGILSLINFNWLQSSVRGLFKIAAEGDAPNFPVFKYVLRFMVIGSIVAIAKMFEIISVSGILLGLCSLVAALMIEAFVQLYLHFLKREEL